MADRVDGLPCDDDLPVDMPDAAPDRERKAASKHEGLPPTVESHEFWSDHYKMDHKERGIAVIINNKTFNPNTRMPPRKGTDVDANKMYHLFETLDFEKIIQKDNLDIKSMENLLTAVSKQDFGNKDCFCCVILSHGDEGYVYGTDGSISIDALVAPFKGNKCRSLAGKPKIFFIQACRGRDFDDGVDAHDGESGEDVDVRRIPTEADFLMSYSVVPGYYSWRNSNNGSWFIQAVADVIGQFWQKLDLLSMMTRVSRKVAYDFESDSSVRGMSGKKQIPCITSMLTKDVFFSKKTA